MRMRSQHNCVRSGEMRKTIIILYLMLIFVLVAVPVLSEDQKASPEGLTPEKASEAEASGVPNQSAKTHEPMVKMSVPLFSPLFSGFPVATVNDENITMEELRDAVNEAHTQMSEDKATVKVNYGDILNRLVNLKLILQDAEEMGINELPEVGESVTSYKKNLMRDLVKSSYIKKAKADSKEIERIYKELTKEWKIRSVLFFDEEDAKKALSAAKEGNNFADLAVKAVSDKKAKGDVEPQFVKPGMLMPKISEAITKMKVGELSPVIEILAGKDNSGYSIVELLDVRNVDNQELRKKAEQEALANKKATMLLEYRQSLYKQYVKVDRKLFESLDFAAKKPGIEKFLKDKRTIAVIKGQKPITVGDLAEAVKKSFFHGMESASAEDFKNRKTQMLEKMLGDRVLDKEAIRMGLDKTDQYMKAVKEYKDSIIFGAYLEKVIIPDVKIKHDEIESYYNEHLSEFSTPLMMRVRSIAFKERRFAESAIEKLRKGTDFNWMVSHAEGQVEPDDKRLEIFDQNLITVKSMPEGMQKAVAGSSADDIKLYESPAGYFYAVLIMQVVPAKPAALEAVKGQITEKLIAQKLKKSMDELAAKLRQAGDVKIFLSEAGQ